MEKEVPMSYFPVWWHQTHAGPWGSMPFHYNDVIMGAIASLITSLTIVYSTVYSDADQRKRQSSALLAFVRGIHRCPVNSPHKWPVTRKMFPFDDVIMSSEGNTIYVEEVNHLNVFENRTFKIATTVLMYDFIKTFICESAIFFI